MTSIARDNFNGHPFILEERKILGKRKYPVYIDESQLFRKN